MISVVICSVNASLARQIKSNIDNTIGVPCQLIIIENTNPSKPITHVYNEGVRQAIFPLVCFVHEDVCFTTKNWGQLVVECFEKDASLGMLGIAGAAYKSKTLSGWMTNIEAFDRYNITHLDPTGQEQRMYFDQPPAAATKEVVTLDGVFMCAPVRVLQEIPFEEEMLSGFHLYDIDISFRISRRYKVMVSYQINMIHYTEGGDFGNKWVEFTMKWHEKYQHLLPAAIDVNDLTQQPRHEARVSHFWLKRLRTERISVSNKLKWLRATRAFGHPSAWFHIGVFLFYRPARRLIGKK